MKKSASGFECGNCGQSETKAGDMSVCGRCFRIRYCGRACQAAHWKKGGHKNMCIPAEACKPSVQPQEDRAAEIQCLICLGTEGRIYEHSCRAKIHLTCLAELFGHHSCRHLVCKHNKIPRDRPPPCPICREPLPEMNKIFDHLMGKGQFDECKELSTRMQHQCETDHWIMFKEASFNYRLGLWDKCIELFRTFIKNGPLLPPAREMASRHVQMAEEARLCILEAEKRRDHGLCACEVCAAVPL